MKKLAGFALIAALSACGGSGSNPVTGGDAVTENEDTPVTDDSGDPVEQADPNGNAGRVFAFDTARFLVANRLDLDEDTNEVIVNNVPFDRPSGRYILANGALSNDFQVYESVEEGETGQRKYFAVYQKSDSGNSQAGAIGTGDYLGFGYGGATAQRLSENPSLPAEGEYIYAGQYGAIRVVNGNAGENDVQVVTGNALFEIDILDFDETGAVEGRITDRVAFDNRGGGGGTALIGDVIIATSPIDFEKGEVTGDDVAITLLDANGNPTNLMTGNFKGVFAGDDGGEFAGYVVLEGNVSTEPESAEVREVGSFIVVD